ncbi:2-methylaconitate cis-trans isomerase PrpF family protein [Scopulibacillus cellulosilyticus]|uniref:2-methylaconitate cis-trans isomerase PrpF family protein n=1 Tax=Scopulibacillus cellulosilyticus TaxID=2665665 RepID=A0ABW2PQN8_9BACL
MYYLGNHYRVFCTLMRGGTSKGAILRKIDLPSQPNKRDRMILRIFGSPDQDQIDGLGGGTSLTSKLALVGPPTFPDSDITYTFGQVSLDKEVIDYEPTCGNMATAVGLYAVEEGYIELTEPITRVRIFNTNIQKVIIAEIPVFNGQVQYEGDFSIDGVPGSSARIMLNFPHSEGALTGKLLPTGHPEDLIKLNDGRTFHVSIIDAANVVVFVDARELGLLGNELKEDIDSATEILETLEQIRVKAGRRIGIIQNENGISPSTHALPKIAFVSPPKSYRTMSNQTIDQSDIDILARYISMGSLHKAFAVSGAVALAASAKIEGTIPNQVLPANISQDRLRIGHPSGQLYLESELEMTGSDYQVIRCAIGRTARRLMDGYAYIPASVLTESDIHNENTIISKKGTNSVTG